LPRRAQIGDTWTYTVTGDQTGSVTRGIVEAVNNPAGNRCAIEATIGDGLPVGTVGEVNATLSRAGADGALYACGLIAGERGTENETRYNVGRSSSYLIQIRPPGLPEVGDQYAGMTWYEADGDTLLLDWRTTVEGWESVSVPAGTFMAWVTTTHTIVMDSGVESVREWLAPAVGVVRKDVEIRQNLDWDEVPDVQYQSELTSYQVRP